MSHFSFLFYRIESFVKLESPASYNSPTIPTRYFKKLTVSRNSSLTILEATKLQGHIQKEIHCPGL